ncbi:MAG: diguanylate cyclase [Chitinispirillia bacterium]|nr:diguanylate cyclase [Chitinispirillia bacterium]MCL2241750.1 diguanylate cyclase [Chitinispirillia bacterium]
METTGNTASGQPKVLVVDDDESICDLLKAALSARYDVTSCLNGRDAVALIGERDFDAIITDLILPDISGIDILAYAKNRDEFAEVLMITGNATVDSAASAINQGVASYMLKPFSIPELRGRVEKMVASREFHRKSLQLIKRDDISDPEVKGHINDVNSLYHFTRKLMLTLEIAEVMRIILEEANQKAGALFCSLEVDLLEYREVYSMPITGEAGRETLDKVFADSWASAFTHIDRESFQKGGIQHYIYKGRQGTFTPLPEYKCLNYPLIVTGKSIGSLSVWTVPGREIGHRLDQYLHILTSITSPVIEHVYTDLQARFQAKTDSLTGIANHRHFYEVLEREIARANRKKTTFALVLADIDNFKLINDTFGHPVGDAVIIELTRRLNANVRTGDVVARYGGEEFGVILTDTDLEGAAVLANRVCESVAATPFTGAKHELTCTASFGLAAYDGTKPVSKGELIFRADQALYRSKREGKNRVTVAD